MTRTEKLGEQIRQTIEDTNSARPKTWDDFTALATANILALCKESGLAFVDEEAELPQNPYSQYAQYRKRYTWKKAQKDMLETGYRKTEPIEGEMAASDTVLVRKQAYYDQAKATWPVAYQAGFDEGIKKTLDAADSTFGALLRKERQAGIEIGYKRGLGMKPDPDPVYENGMMDGREKAREAGIREVVEWVKRHMSCTLVGETARVWRAKLESWEVTDDTSK